MVPARVPARRSPSPSPKLGERIRSLRTAAGLTQIELAVRSDVALQTLGLAERVGFVTPTTATKLAGVLGVRPAELLP